MSETMKRTWAQISTDNIEHNYKCIKALIKPNCKIIGIVKADAYGHGAPFVANRLKSCGVNYFGVSNIDEAVQLRINNIKEPIIILGYTPKENFQVLFNYDLTQTVFSLQYATLLSHQAKKLNKKLKIHIKVDTGMSRLGFLCNNEQNIAVSVNEIENISKLKVFELEGIFTHFAVSDDLKSNYTTMQFELFTKTISALKIKGISFKYKHCCNSSAIINYPEMHLNMVRPGLILYGLYPCKNIKDIGLKPVMELKTVISQIKEFDEGVTVSYGRVYKTNKKTKIAIMPIGYADGFPRILSNNAEVLVCGKRANVVGRVCMDMTMIDITNISNAKEGQCVTIFGKDKEGYIPIEELADKMETINYEIACLIGKRVPRIYTLNGTEMGNLNYILNNQDL